MKWNRERVLEVYRLYRRVGSYSKVGKEIGLTRERVRQIFLRGIEMSWIDKENFDRSCHRGERPTLNGWTSETISQALLDTGSRCRTAFQLGLSLKKFDRLCMDYGIDWRLARKEYFVRKIVKQFSNFINHGEKFPSSYLLQRSNGGKALYHRILSHFHRYEDFISYLKNHPSKCSRQ